MKKASYRKISTYTKSVERYTRERERRRQVRLLAEEGFTQRQIASELGVSIRTIKRDCDKTRSYVKGQFNKEMRQIADERSEQFERRYEGLTFNEDSSFSSKTLRRFLRRRGHSRPVRSRKSNIGVSSWMLL